jgi:hypothetical protein
MNCTRVDLGQMGKVFPFLLAREGADFGPFLLNFDWERDRVARGRTSLACVMHNKSGPCATVAAVERELMEGHGIRPTGFRTGASREAVEERVETVPQGQTLVAELCAPGPRSRSCRVSTVQTLGGPPLSVADIELATAVQGEAGRDLLHRRRWRRPCR